MTKHGGTFTLSGETRDLLRENQEFYEDILGLYDPQDPEKIPLKIAGRDPEARTEAKVQPNGEVEVSFVLPLDDDADPANGRIYLRDTFQFDPGEKKLKSYRRAFEYNGKGQGAWQAWLEKYRENLNGNPLSVDDPQVQKFAFSAGTAFGRPLTDEAGLTLPEFSQAFQREHRYLDTTHLMVTKHWQDLHYKIKDKLNSYTLVRRGDQVEVTFHIAIDADDDPANGRLILSDTMTVDAKTWDLKKFSRLWSPSPEMAGSEEWIAAADSMNEMTANLGPAEKKKLSEESEAFLRNLAPLLLTGVDLKPEDTWKIALAAPRGETGAPGLSPLARRLQPDPRRGEGSAQILEAMSIIAGESLALKHDTQSGWWNRKILGRAPLDLHRAQASLQGIFDKSREALKAKPQSTAFEVLESLPLEGEEALARDRLLADRLLKDLNAIGKETDPELRAQALLHFTEQKLVRRFNMVSSAQFLLAELRENPFVRKKAEEALATLAGTGAFGRKFEAFLPRFAEQVAHPATLIAMGGAPFLGAAAEGLGLAGLSRAGLLANMSGRVNWGGRLFASGLGLTGEALAFTSLHQAGQSAVHDPAQVTSHFKQEFYSSLLLFGAMRLAHAGMNPLTARFLTKKPAEAELLASPTGRILLNPRWGGGEATRLGKVLPPALFNHGAGIVGMHVANSLSRRWGLMPDNGQDGASHFLDSALTYGQAVLGFSLANRLTFGRLQGGLAETKLRLENFGVDPKSLPLSSKSRPVSSAPKGSALTFKFGGLWNVDARKQNAIWIGSMPGRRPGVEYEVNSAKVNIGPEETVSEYHAVLTRDKTGIFWYVGDAGSTYGTYVNGQLLGKGESVRLKDGFLLQLGDSYQLRIEVDGKLITPDKSVKTVVELPRFSAQKRLGPPTPAEHFPFETLYPGIDLPPDAVVEVAQLRPKKGEPQVLTSKTTSWGKAGTSHLYVDPKGRWVLENLNVDAPIHVTRPAKGETKEQQWTLKRTDKLSSEEEQAAGRQDWVFLESGDRIGLGAQSFEFVAHDSPVLGSVADSARTFARDDSAPLPAARPEEPAPAEKLREPELEEFDERPTLTNIRVREEDLEDRPTLVNIQPVPREALRRSEESEITQVRTPQLTEVKRVLGPMPPDYLSQIPNGTPVFELLFDGRRIRSDRNATSYMLGRDPEPKEKTQSGVVVPGRLLERNHAEIFLGQIPGKDTYNWFLTDKDSAFGTFVGGEQGRKLAAGANREYVPLRSGSTFSLGAPSGGSEAVEFTFHLPWAPANAETAKPADVFPVDLIRHLPAEQPPMELVDNFNQVLFSAERFATRYIIGREPEIRATPNARTVVFNRPNVDLEHCEIFTDQAGNWYLRVLTAEESTYLNDKKILAGATVLLPPNAEVALGGDLQSGYGMTFRLKRAPYQAPDGRELGSPEARSSDLPADLDGEAQTVKPPPPRRPASDDPNTTLVMGVQTREELVRRSTAEEDSPTTVRRPSQPPSPSPNVIRRSKPPQPPRPLKKPSRPPPLPPQPKRTPEAAPSKPEEWDFSDIRDEVVGDGTDFNLGKIGARAATPPPRSGSEPVPVIPGASPVPKVEPSAEGNVPVAPLRPLKPSDPALAAIHPELRSRVLADQLKSWITENKAELKSHVDLINRAFPRFEPANEVSLAVQGSTETLPMFFRRVMSWEAAARAAHNEQVAKFSEGSKKVFAELGEIGATQDFGQVFKLNVDNQTLRYISEGGEGLDTAVLLNIRSGGEEAMLRGIHEKLLKLEVPVKIAAPLSTEGSIPAYLGIVYSAVDAPKVHRAVREFARDYSEALGEGTLYFTQPLKGFQGEKLEGVGVTEYFQAGKTVNPLADRFRSAVVGANTAYAKGAKEQKSYSQEEHFRQSVRIYWESGYDLANPGFRQGSLESTHRALIPDIYFED